MECVNHHCLVNFKSRNENKYFPKYMLILPFLYSQIVYDIYNFVYTL